MTLREMWRRVAFWRRREALERELRDEIQAHVELLAHDLEHEGLSPAEALAAARRQVGNAGRVREESRDFWGFPAVDIVLQDLRYALRALVRSPGFTGTVVVTLALGIGANAAMFGVIDRLMFRPFPYMREPAQVNRVYLQTLFRGRVRTNSTIPYTRYLDLKRFTTTFSQYAALSEWRVAVGTGDEARVRKIAGVSASFFDFFDARPVVGRFFVAAEDSVPLGALVAVLSHAFWMTEFGGRDVTGQTLQVGSLPYTLIGVAPEGFVGTVSGRQPDLFVPVTTVPANIDRSNRSAYFVDYRWDWVDVMVRRKSGVSEAMASANLTSALIQSRNAARAVNPAVLPDSVARPRAIASALKDAAGPDAGLESRTLLWVTGVAGIVLLIACANVANLMFARVLRRRREIAVRLALGVSKRRLVAQFLTESLLLAALGCIGGLVVAQWAGVAIRRLLLPEGSPFNLMADWRTLSVAAGCAVSAAVLTAFGPAVLATRADLAASLKAGVREGTYHRSRTRSALLIVQGALSVVLLVGAGLFVRSLHNVLAIPLGFDATPVLEVIPDFRGLQTDSATTVAVRRRLLAAAQALPGVEYAARVNTHLFFNNSTDLRVSGVDSVARLGRFNFQMSTPDYFKVMRTRIVRGRAFTDADREGTPPVVVVSEAMARVLWPGRDPIGQCIQVGWGAPGSADTKPCTTVVGVAEDAAHQSLTDNERFVYYLAVDQQSPASASTFLLRMAGPNPSAQIERVRHELQKVMPGQGFVVVRPVQEVVDDQSRSWRLGATMFVAFGGLALLVAAVGLYGVIGYNVARRMHELGVRIALGAQSRDVVRLVVGQGISFAFAGVAIGLGLALVAARWIQPLLFQQSARDPVTYAAVGGLIVLVGLVASAVPAMRASRADPNSALRSD
jgi:putative ABC transport system permease protein